MKKKCDKCRGRGGHYSMRGRFLNNEVWVECPQCRGKGKWFTNHQPKRSPKVAATK